MKSTTRLAWLVFAVFVITLLLVFAYMGTAGAVTNPVCGPRSAILAALKKTWAETPVAGGLLGDAAVMELMLSASGSWTVIRTDTSGTSCVIASGQEWRETGSVIAPGQDS